MKKTVVDEAICTVLIHTGNVPRWLRWLSHLCLKYNFKMKQGISSSTRCLLDIRGIIARMLYDFETAYKCANNYYILPLWIVRFARSISGWKTNQYAPRLRKTVEEALKDSEVAKQWCDNLAVEDAEDFDWLITLMEHLSIEIILD